MRYAVAVCIFIVGTALSQAQTLLDSSESIENQTQSLPNASLTVKTSNPPSRTEVTTRTNESPDAPAPIVSNSPTWKLEETPLLSPRRLDPIWDRKMWAAHIVLAGSMIFDVEMTHQGLAHHQCVEGNNSLEAKPSRGELYVDNLKQFGPILLMDWLGAAAARSGHLPRWVWKPMGYAGPVYGSIDHIRGGLAWFTQCW